MKKIFLIITLACLSILTYGQSERVFTSDMKITKVAPKFTLSGLGATLLMDGATSGTTTLRPYAVAGGTIVIPQSASTDTLETKASARSGLSLKVNVADSTLPAEGHYFTYLQGSLKADTVSQSFTGTTVISRLNVGSATSATKAEIDSTAMVGTKIADFIGADTTDRYITVAGRVELNTVTVMVDDTLASDGIYYTQRQVDSLAALKANLSSPALTDTPTAPTAAVGTNTTQIATTAFVLANTSNSISKLVMKIDSTANAPAVGDSVYSDSRLIGTHIEIYRSDGDTAKGMTRQYVQNWADGTTYGYYFDSTTGRITFHPPLIAKERIDIEITTAANWTLINPAAYYPEYADILTAMANDPTGDSLTWQNDVVKSLVDGGYWDRIKLLYMPIAASSLADSYINWAAPGTYDLTLGDAPGFDRVNGWDGTASSYLKTGWVPSTDSTQNVAPIGRNNITLAVWTTTNVAPDYMPIGVIGGNSSRLSMYISTSGAQSAIINGTAASDFGGADPGSKTGLTIITRRGKTELESYVEESDSFAHFGDDTDASTGLPNAEVYVMARNNVGTADSFYQGVVSIVLVMNQVSDAEAAGIYAIFNTFMTHMGQ